MKVGIVTITQLNNYGNRLQNYAMQEFLFELGYNPETINEYSNHIFKKAIKQAIYILGKIFPFNSSFINVYSRHVVFEKFNKKYIKFASFSLQDKNIIKKAKKYKFVVCGSDQIWNPYFSCGKSDNSFLIFVEEKKRIALCASFGCEKIPIEQEERYRKLISGIKKISVREERGKEIIEGLISKERRVDVFLDPVFWIEQEKWNRLASDSKIHISSKYILISYVDEKRTSRKEIIENFAHDKGLQLIYLQDINNKMTYQYNPCDFLFLIKNAEFILTDSFHATAFSILYHKPFLVLEGRKKSDQNMDSRLNTLLNTFSLLSRKIEDEDKIMDFEWYFQDVSRISKIIQENKRRVIDFLEELCI